MASSGAPVVQRAGSTAPDAPLVVLLHGRGSDENDLIGLAEVLPEHLAVAAPRGPVALPDGGYTWFENAGLGRPLPESLNTGIRWLTDWLATVAPSARPIVPVGFSAGALFGGGMALTDPTRYAGYALLMGALPLDAGLTTSGRPWSGLPVLALHAEADEVMPAELMAQAWRWVHEDSGATLTSGIVPGGHTVGREVGDRLAGWLTGLFPG